QGIDQGARFDLGEADVGIGRHAQNDVPINDTEASRAHARIQYIDSAYVLQDLSSSNGTYVNGRSIRTRPLANGDHIQIGRSLLLLSQTPSSDESIYVAKKITLLGQHDPDDHSNIVGATIPADGQDLVSRIPEAGSAAFAQTLANLQVLYRISEEAVRPSISL